MIQKVTVELAQMSPGWRPSPGVFPPRCANRLAHEPGARCRAMRGLDPQNEKWMIWSLPRIPRVPSLRNRRKTMTRSGRPRRRRGSPSARIRILHEAARLPFRSRCCNTCCPAFASKCSFHARIFPKCPWNTLPESLNLLSTLKCTRQASHD